MQLYIDSNIYLEYFRENSAERLTPLKELVKLIENKKIKLLLPSQTKQEYFRNRRKIAEITRSALIRQGSISSIIPAVIDKENSEIKNVLSNTKKLMESYKKLIKKYDNEVEKEKTDADLLINKLFLKHAREIKETDEIVTSAYKRYMKGNPPRKNDHSYGDAIIWETILKEGENDDLVLITKDGDFIEIYKGKPIINHFLFIEWKIKTNKKGNVVLYKSLGEFVNTFNNKPVIKKEIVQEENENKFSPIVTKGLSYNIQGVTGPTGPSGTFDLTGLGGYSSSVIGRGTGTFNVPGGGGGTIIGATMPLQNSGGVIFPVGGGGGINIGTIYSNALHNGSNAATRYCHSCGTLLLPNNSLLLNQFCPNCGAMN